MTVYLDHAATTPVRPEARDAVLGVLDAGLGNPSGAHRLARRARQIVDEARDELAALWGCRPVEIVFTGGGTEADALALHGHHGDGLVVSAVEHPAVAAPARLVGALVAPVDNDGVVDLDRLPTLLSPVTGLVSVMAVNNETGVVQPLAAVAALLRRHAPAAVLHTDAVQAAPWFDLSAVAADADLVSVSGHKLGAPQGVGALVVRGRATVHPILIGGGQEVERRAGTHNVAGIAALAAAARASAAARDAENERLGVLRDRLVKGLCARIAGCEPTIGAAPTAPGIAHLTIEGIAADIVLAAADRAGLCASAGASCASGAHVVSPVLAAMGRPGATGAVRLSLGWTTRESDIDAAVDLLGDAVDRYRAAA